jgi:hypothetical protein
MSKLFKLKEYYSFPEAAKYLTNVFEEDVTIADIYRLGLDKHIKLSINFVNQAKVRKGKLILKSEANTVQPLFKDNFWKGLKDLNGNKIDVDKVEILEGLNFDNDYQLILEGDISTVDGVWDLCMVANGQLDIEHQYQQLTSEIAVNLYNMEGTYVEKIINGEKIILEIQERHSKEDLEKIHGENLPSYNNSRNYYPASALPPDSPLIIKSSELAKIVNTLMEDPTSLEQPVSEQKDARTPESSIVDSLGIMAYMLSESITGLKWGQNPNASKIVKAIEQKAASLGIESTEITNLERDISAALKKITPKISKI